MVEYLNNNFVANLPLSPSVKKKFKDRLIFGEVMGKSLVSNCFFLIHSIGLGLKKHTSLKPGQRTPQATETVSGQLIHTYIIKVLVPSYT